MPNTGEGKNIMLNALYHTTNRYVGGGTASAATPVEASAIGSVIKKTQSLANGTLLYFSVLSGGTGLVALRPYYVINKSGTQFEVSNTEGGSAVSFSSELKAASEYIVLTEIVYAESGKRIVTAFGAAAEGKVEDTTGHVLKIPAGKTINAEMYNEAEEGIGASKHWLGISVLTTPETYGSNGTYEVKSTEADLMLAEGTPAP
jgi:hypothetical protein